MKNDLIEAGVTLFVLGLISAVIALPVLLLIKVIF